MTDEEFAASLGAKRSQADLDNDFAKSLGAKKAEGTTSLWEDIKTPIAGSLNTLDLLGDMLKAPFRNEKEMNKATDDLEWRRRGRRDWANPEGKKQTLGGKVAGAVATLPLGVATMGLTPIETTNIALESGETDSRARAAGAVDAFGNAIGMAIPFAAPALGPVTNTVLGFAGNAAQDAITKDIISRKILQTPQAQKALAPTAEDAVVAGVIGAGMTAATQTWKSPTRNDFDARLNALAETKKAEAAGDTRVYVDKAGEATVGPSVRIEESPEMVALFKALAEKKTEEAKGTFYVDPQGRATKDLPTQIKEDPSVTDAARDMQQQRLEDRATELGKGTGETMDMFPAGEQGNLDLSSPFRGMGRSQAGAINLPDILKAMKGVKDRVVEPYDYLKLWKGAFAENEWGPALESLRNPKSRDTVVLMSPDDFHQLAARRSDPELRAPYTEGLRQDIREGLKARDGLREMPYLRVDEDGQVEAHEGRHRMDVFKEQGVDLVPVRLRSAGRPWGERGEPLALTPQDAKNYSPEGKAASSIPAPSFIKEPKTPTNAGPRGSQRGAIDPDLLTFGLASKIGQRLQKAKALEESIGQKIYQEPTDPKLVVAAALNEGKDGRGFNNFEAGATLAAEKRGSALIKGVSRIVQRAKNIAEDSIRTHVFPVEKSLRDLKIDEIGQLAKVMKKEMFIDQKFSMDELAELGLSEKQMRAYNNVRTMFDESLRAQNKAREAQGLPIITPKEAYLSSRWQGDFRRAVFDKKGRLVWYLAATTKLGLERQTKALLKDFPELSKKNMVDHTQPSLRHTGRDLNSVYTLMLDVLGRDNPDVQKLKDWYEQNLEKNTSKAFAQTKHFEEKSNIRGFVGDRPGANPRKEAIDMFQQQIMYSKNAFKWAQLQEAGIDLKTIFGDEKLQAQQPNNMRYAQDYFKDQLGASDSKIAKAIDQHFKDMGISPKLINDGIGSVKNLWITQKLAASLGFMASNVIQATNVLPQMVLMQTQFGGNPLNILGAIGFALPVGTAMATGHVTGTAATVRRMFGTLPLPNEFLLKMMKYAEDNSVTARSIYDESPVQNTFTATGKLSNLAGKTISTPETFLRSFTYLAYATQLKLSGKFKNDLDVFRLAEERTNISMGDYREGERALIFNKMGTAGNAMNVLQTFPINFYQNYSLMSREALKGNVAPLLTMIAVQGMAAGMMGLPGFSDADKLVNWIKDWLAENAPTYWNKVKNIDLKKMMIDTFGETALYGALSTETGVAMTSRAAAPAGSDMLANPVAPFMDLGEQAVNIGKSLIDPADSQKRAQALLGSAPVGMQGYLETGPLRDETSVETDKGRLYKTRDLAERQGSVYRTPEQEALRATGLRSQQEVFEKDMAYSARKTEVQTQAVLRTIPDKFYNAVRKNDMETAREYMTLYAQLSGRPMTEEMFKTRILKEYTSAADKASTKATTIDGMVAVKRLRDLLAEQK